MTVQLNTLLQGKALVTKNNNQYLSAKDYVEPFVERLKVYTDDFRCQVKTPDSFSLTEGEPDLVYIRVNVQAVLPQNPSLSYHKVIGMTYALDVKRPHVKFYVGALDNEHENLIVFDESNQIIKAIDPDIPIDYSGITSLIEKTDYIDIMVKQLQATDCTRDFLFHSIGDWISFLIDRVKGLNNEFTGKIKLSKSTVIDAFENLVKNMDSEFYINDLNHMTLYDIYMALLGVIRDDDKDICNKFEKTIIVKEMLQL